MTKNYMWGRTTPQPEKEIDPELQAAVDDFFDSWKARVMGRLEMGEEQYHGKWKEMSADEVMKELMDEVFDMVAYAAFYRHKTTTPPPGPDERVRRH